MQKLLTILLVVFCAMSADAQVNDKKLKKAEKYYGQQDYELAIPLYKEMFDMMEKGEDGYQRILTGYSNCLFYANENMVLIPNWDKAIEYGRLYLDAVHFNIRLIEEARRPDKYRVCQNMVLAYFTLGHLDSAVPYREMLYEGYKDVRLPIGMGKAFNFERFVYDGKNVVGFESYANPRDKGNGPMFAKFYYNVYARGPKGQDATLLYSIKAVPYNKINFEDPDLVLTKATYMNNREISEVIGAATYKLPIDYDRLYDDVIAVLKGDYKATGRTVNRM